MAICSGVEVLQEKAFQALIVSENEVSHSAAAALISV